MLPRGQQHGHGAGQDARCGHTPKTAQLETLTEASVNTACLGPQERQVETFGMRLTLGSMQDAPWHRGW